MAAHIAVADITQREFHHAERLRRIAGGLAGASEADLDLWLDDWEMQRGIEDGSIRSCDVRMTGNAIMGALNWVPKWFRGDTDVARQAVREFPQILSAGLDASGR